MAPELEIATPHSATPHSATPRSAMNLKSGGEIWAPKVPTFRRLYGGGGGGRGGGEGGGGEGGGGGAMNSRYISVAKFYTSYSIGNCVSGTF